MTTIELSEVQEAAAAAKPTVERNPVARRLEIIEKALTEVYKMLKDPENDCSPIGLKGVELTRDENGHIVGLVAHTLKDDRPDCTLVCKTKMPEADLHIMKQREQKGGTETVCFTHAHIDNRYVDPVRDILYKIGRVFQNEIINLPKAAPTAP